MRRERSKRVSQIGALIRHTLADLLASDVRDPRLSSVTLASVDVSPDLSHAVIYFFLPDAQQLAAASQAFLKASPFLRCRLAEKIKFRHVPQLRFEYDASLDRGETISLLIDRVRRES